MSKQNFFVAAALFALIALPVTTHAQRPGKDGSREKMAAVGELKGIQGGAMHILTSTGEQWMVAPSKDPEKMTYQAIATPSWLKKGMWVELTATFDAKGKSHGSVNSLTVMTPNKETKIGVNRMSALDAGPATLFSDDEPVKSDVETASYQVIGRVTGITAGGELSITAGRTPVKVELAKTAQVAVKVTGLQLARPGDKVSVEGWYSPQQPQRAYANMITVTSQDTLGETKKPEPKE